MAALSAERIHDELTSLPGWAHEGDAIRKTFTFAGFTAAVAFVQRLVEPANAARHHPDLEIHYDRVTVTLTTHDEGGVTERDIGLARTIESLSEPLET